MTKSVLLFPMPAKIRRYGENGAEGEQLAAVSQVPPIGGGNEDVCTFGPGARIPWGNVPLEERRRAEEEWRLIEKLRRLSDEQKDYMLALGEQLQRRARRCAAHDLNRE